MPYSDIYLYSPLTIKSVKEGHNRAILLEFILAELIHAMESDKKEDPLDFVFATSACFFPADFSLEVGCLNKVGDHAKLLPYAFPTLKSSIHAFNKTQTKVFDTVYAKKKMGVDLSHEELLMGLREIYYELVPFLIACKESEDLLLFLLKNSEEIGTLGGSENVGRLLMKMFPEGHDKIAHLIRRGYQAKGDQKLLEEMDRIQSHYEK